MARTLSAPAAALRNLESVRFCHDRYMPAPEHLQPRDVLVIDLDDLPACATPDAVNRLADQVQVVLASGSCHVAPDWLDMAGGDGVVLARCCEADRDKGCAPLIHGVLQRIKDLSPRVIAFAVLAAHPGWVGVLEAEVIALVDDPWRIRLPSHLAATLGQTLRSLRARFQGVGYERIEHFMHGVRMAIREHLRKAHGVRVARANAMAGISDNANARRQLKRARQSRGFRGGGGVGGLAVLTLLCVGVASCGGGDRTAEAAPADSSRASAEPMVLPVVGALVRRGDLVLSVRATGAVRADRLVNLKAETQGTVADVPVHPGDHVAAGQVLVRLDPRPLDLAVREAEGALQEAQMRLQDALLGDQADDTTEISRQRRANARLRSGIGGAEARLERARLDRDRAEVVAPFAGVLDQVNVVAGQRIGPGDAVARLVDLTTLTIEASVLEHDLPLIRVGGAATVTPSSGAGARLRGTIGAVLPLVDTTSRSGRALVRVQGGGALRPGMYADVELEATRLTNRILVPAVAVIERDGRPLVFRAREGRAEWVYVQLGRSNGTETEILADSITGQPAVAAADTVLVSGHLTLTHDAPVQMQLAARPRQ